MRSGWWWVYRLRSAVLCLGGGYVDQKQNCARFAEFDSLNREEDLSTSTKQSELDHLR